MSNHEVRSVTTELRIATAEDGSRSIAGFIPYNSESVDLGGFSEFIAPGAFASALEATADVLALRDHDSKLLLGRTKSGTLSLTDTTEGLRYSIKLPNTTAANDLAESISRGDLDGTSFGFTTNEDKWSSADSKVVRTLLNVELYEVSPCSFPAYPDSGVALRSAPAEIRTKLEHRDDDAEEDTAPTACQCDCPSCVAGDCVDCTDAECDDDLCTCDSGADEFDAVRSAMEMMLALRQRK